MKRAKERKVSRLKACLVEMGFSQEKGIDYEEVFAPATRLETLRVILTLLASKKWCRRLLNFKTAFLNDNLNAPFYMTHPEGYKDPRFPDHFCKASRSIYGLKKSPRMWNRELHEALISLGLHQSVFDPTLYLFLVNSRLKAAIPVHVDDLAIVGESPVVDLIRSKLRSHFKISAHEPLHHFLLIKIRYLVDQRRVLLS